MEMRPLACADVLKGRVKMSKAFAFLFLIIAALVPAQDSPKKLLTLTDASTVSADDMSRALSKDCPNVSLTNDPAKSDFKLEASKKTTRPGLGIEHVTQFDLTLFDRDGNMFNAGSDTSLKHLVKELCHAIKTFVAVEVVDTQTLTQSRDVRGDTSGSAAGTVVNNLTGRRTHTDASTIYVVVKGEHALLDCYERRTGCTTIGPGKYYGELDGDGIWISHLIPITHKPMREHYKIAGSW